MFGGAVSYTDAVCPLLNVEPPTRRRQRIYTAVVTHHVERHKGPKEGVWESVLDVLASRTHYSSLSGISELGMHAYWKEAISIQLHAPDRLHDGGGLSRRAIVDIRLSIEPSMNHPSGPQGASHKPSSCLPAATTIKDTLLHHVYCAGHAGPLSTGCQCAQVHAQDRSRVPPASISVSWRGSDILETCQTHGTQFGSIQTVHTEYSSANSTPSAGIEPASIKVKCAPWIRPGRQWIPPRGSSGTCPPLLSITPHRRAWAPSETLNVSSETCRVASTSCSRPFCTVSLTGQAHLCATVQHTISSRTR
ncbi:hypothetical protein C8Q72DRAFT_371767 [Fomitopsis betulina]|nr:hypothetical protein C8Q72DRAFT_371767 [Fomitopsis betulina]